MQSNWSYVVASYLLTAAAIIGYTLYLRGRSREAEQQLTGERE